jgi:hypothetical protein
MSKIEVDAIEPQSGTTLTIGASGDTITIPSGATLTNSGTATGFGKVLQVVSVVKTDTFTHTSSTFTDVTGLSVAITPSSASNKILILAQLNVGTNNSQRGGINIVRTSTSILLGDTASSRTRTSMAVQSMSDAQTFAGNIIFLDSPNTTSATTYKIQVSIEGSSSIHINKNHSDIDNATVYRGASTLTLIEIAG